MRNIRRGRTYSFAPADMTWKKAILCNLTPKHWKSLLFHKVLCRAVQQLHGKISNGKVRYKTFYPTVCILSILSHPPLAATCVLHSSHMHTCVGDQKLRLRNEGSIQWNLLSFLYAVARQDKCRAKKAQRLPIDMHWTSPHSCDRDGSPNISLMIRGRGRLCLPEQRKLGTSGILL